MSESIRRRPALSGMADAMNLSSSMQRYGLAIAACGAGVVLAWLSGEPSCLLAAVAVTCIYGGRGPGLLSIGICGLAFAFVSFFPGSYFPFEVNAPLRLAAFLAAALVVGLLIPDYQKTASAHRSERETRLIVESIPGHGWSTDPNGKFRYVNPSVLDYIGRPIADLNPEGQDSFGWKQVVHPDDAGPAAEKWLQSLETGEPYEVELRIRRFDGIYRWFRAASRPSRDRSGKIAGWYGMTLDIEDHRRTEEALRASERNLRSIIDRIPGMITSANAEGEDDYANQRLLDYLGMKLPDVIKLGWLEYIPTEERDVVANEWTRCTTARVPMDIVHRIRRSDGVYRWFHVRVEPAMNDRGEVVRWYGLLIDVEEQKAAEAALQRSEQQLRLLIDTMPAMAWCTTATGEASYFSKRTLEYVGLTSEDLTRSPFLAVHPDDIAPFKRLWAHSVATGRSFAFTYRLRRADGVFRWHEGRAEPLREQAGAVVQWYGVNVDIDDRMEAEHALRSTQARFLRASQLASLAELSASIAHEVNQPLAAVVTNSHACQRWLSADPPNLQRARATTDRIIRDANSAAEVVGRIRALFKQTTASRTSLDLNEAITEVCQLMSDDVTAKNISVEADLEKNLPAVAADRVQVQQVLVNLIRNGIDAMESTAGGPKSLLIRSRRDGTNMALVEVRDHGSGVEDTDRIFEPFFTTKEKGMGMGLAICRSIVEAHDGRLWAAKNEPRGTTLSFTLPVRAGDSK